MVRLFHDTYDDLRVKVERPIVEAEGDTARMSLVCYLYGTHQGQRGYILGTGDASCTGTIIWKKGRDGWHIISARDLDVPQLRYAIGTDLTPGR